MDKKEPSKQILRNSNGKTIAYRRISGMNPGIIFLGGFRSDMWGSKAVAIEEFCSERGHSFAAFDYMGHGESSGKFIDGTIGGWLSDSLEIIDYCSDGPQILIGSSMGGWIMLLAALARPSRVSALIGIAAAPDFTEDLMWNVFDKKIKETLIKQGKYFQRGEATTDSYYISLNLIEEARNHLMLRQNIPISIPVRLIHGMDDTSVPWDTSCKIADKLLSEDVHVTLIKDGNHRLSREQDINFLKHTIAELIRHSSG